MNKSDFLIVNNFHNIKQIFMRDRSMKHFLVLVVVIGLYKCQLRQTDYNIGSNLPFNNAKISDKEYNEAGSFSTIQQSQKVGEQKLLEGQQRNMCFEVQYEGRQRQMDVAHHQRSLSSQYPHSFRITNVVNQAVPAGQNITDWLHLLTIGSKYFERILQVMNIPQSMTIPISNDCYFGEIPQPYASNGFDQAVTDMVILIYWVQQNTNVIAAAISCEQYRWTTYGEIYFNLNRISLSTSRNQAYHIHVVTIIHQIIHVLGFSASNYDKFYGNYNSITYLNKNSVIGTHSLTGTDSYIITPTVKKYIQTFFACDDQTIGAKLETTGGSGTAGSHWEDSVFNLQLMMGSIFTPGQHVTHLTFSLLKDTGYYYSVDFAYAQGALWGKQKGCRFALGLNTTSQQYCKQIDSFFCDYEYNYMGPCLASTYSNGNVVTYINDLTLICDWDQTITDQYRYPYSTGGHQTSRCVDSNLVQPNSSIITSPGCFRSECLANGTILIHTEVVTLVCSPQRKSISFLTYNDGTKAYIVCPVYQRFCFRKKCHQDCIGNGFCVNGQCLQGQCSIANCKACTQDFNTTNSTFFIWCETCQDNYVPDFSINETVCLPCSQVMSDCILCGEQAGNTVVCYKCLNGLFPAIQPQNTCGDCLTIIPNCLLCELKDRRTTCALCNASTFPNYMNNLCTGECADAILNCTNCVFNSSINTTQCSVCDSTLYPSMDNVTCQPCSYFISQCEQCTQGIGKIFSCNSCAQGFFLSDDQKSCIKCNQSISNCTICRKQAGNLLCSQCKQPLYPLLNYTACSNCALVIRNCSQSSCILNATSGFSECILCVAGFYVNSSNRSLCIQCDSNCVTCQTTSTKCLTCRNNHILTQTHSCVQIQQSYPFVSGTCKFQQNANNIILCEQGCQVCECTSQTQTLCRSAKQGFQIKSSGNLVRCPSGCKTCNNDSCSVCFPGHFLKSSVDGCVKCGEGCSVCNSTSCKNCFIGFFISSNGSCQPCIGQHCELCDSAGLCVRCLPGYSQQNRQCTQCPSSCPKCDHKNIRACQFCSTGFYLQSGQCIPCIQGCRSCSNSLTCLSCNAGYVLKASKCLSLCAQGCLKCQDSDNKRCQACLAGYQLNSITKICVPILNCTGNCVHCPLKRYSAGNSCLPCYDANCLNCVHNTDCQICDRGYYLSSKFPKQCLKCAQSCFICINSSVCLTCALGYTEQFKIPDVKLYQNISLVPAGSESQGKCVKCKAPCATCQQSVDTCTSCMQGYSLFGWKCKKNNFVTMSLTIDRKYSQFLVTLEYLTLRKYILRSLGNQYLQNPDLLSIIGISQGSTVIIAQIGAIQDQASTGDETIQNSGACSVSRSLSQTFGQGKYINGAKIISSNIQVPFGNLDCPIIDYLDSNNVPLIVGLVVGIGAGLIILIIIVVCLVRFCRKSRKTGNINQSGDNIIQRENQVTNPAISQQKIIQKSYQRQRQGQVDDEADSDYD